MIKEFRPEFPDITMTDLQAGDRVRSSRGQRVVAHSGVAGGLRRSGYDPPFQFVHEDDVARALHHAVIEDLDGPFNLAPADHVEVDEMLRILGRRRINLTEPNAFDMARKLWALGLGEAPAGMLHYLMHPWVVSPARLESTGFRCERSSADAFAETTARAKGFVRIGRSRVNKDAARRGALAGLLLGGAAAGLKMARSRGD